MATDTQTVQATFKPGGMMNPQTWTLAGSELSRNGQLQVDLAEVSRGTWDVLRHRSQITSYLELKSSSGKAKLNCASRGVTADQQQYRHFAAQVLLRLSEVRPEARVHMGGGLSGLAISFFFGVLTLVAGALIFVEAVGWAQPFGDFQEQTPGLMTLVGLALMAGGSIWGWVRRPWDADRLAVPADEAARRVLSEI